MIFHPGASAQAMTVAALAAPTGDIPILFPQKAIPNGLPVLENRALHREVETEG